jgi:hypothetical protein
LKLQTTFDSKPGGRNGGGGGSKKQQAAIEAKQQQSPTTGKAEEEEEEEELTARPHSAIKSFANARWTVTGNNNGVSIDEMLHGGGGNGSGSGSGSGGGNGGAAAAAAAVHHGDSDGQQPSSEERVGPMTPNGYDDISPITRGEWGFLMFGKGKTAGVAMC